MLGRAAKAGGLNAFTAFAVPLHPFRRATGRFVSDLDRHEM